MVQTARRLFKYKIIKNWGKVDKFKHPKNSDSKNKIQEYGHYLGSDYLTRFKVV
jgi:hypothetical protein